MAMTLNELFSRQNFLSKLILKDGNKELSKDLKVKIIKARIEISKIRKSFDEDCQEAIKQMKSSDFDELARKNDKTEEETKKLQEETKKLQADYDAFVNDKLKEKATLIPLTFSDAELAEIVDVNAGNNVEMTTNTGKGVNKVKIPAQDFLEMIGTLFSK